MKKLILVLLLLIFCGCGIVSNLGTPSPHEIKIEPEFDIVQYRPSRTVIIVNVPSWVHLKSDIRKQLTDSVRTNIAEKTKIEAERIVSFWQLTTARRAAGLSGSICAVELAEAAGADLIIAADISDYQLDSVGESDYYRGFLSLRCSAMDKNGVKLWPLGEDFRVVKVGFEVESGGAEKSSNRLAKAAAHCIVRYFYHCRSDKFRIFEEAGQQDYWD